jgi:hypothetical protein
MAAILLLSSFLRLYKIEQQSQLDEEMEQDGFSLSPIRIIYYYGNRFYCIAKRFFLNDPKIKK